MLRVICPTRDNKVQLRHAVSTLYTSTKAEFELVIADEKDLNSIKAMNKYMRTATGDVLLIHDDMNFVKHYKRDWLQEMVDLAKKEEVGLITYNRCVGISDETYLKGFGWFGSWCLYIPKRTLDKIGVFDENMKIGEDIDYTYRVYKAGFTLVTIDICHEHHQHRDSPHTPQDSNIIKEAGVYFKKKHEIQ